MAALLHLQSQHLTCEVKSFSCFSDSMFSLRLSLSDQGWESLSPFKDSWLDSIHSDNLHTLNIPAKSFLSYEDDIIGGHYFALQSCGIEHRRKSHAWVSVPAMSLTIVKPWASYLGPRHLSCLLIKWGPQYIPVVETQTLFQMSFPTSFMNNKPLS